MDGEAAIVPADDPETAPRELTIDEAVALAVTLQKTEQLAAADTLLRAVLEVMPEHAAALHYAGVLAHQLGRSEEALPLIERSLALAPDRADWYSNLGIVYQSGGRLAEAIEAYRRAIAIDPGHANAHSNLGVALRLTGQPSEAETEYRAAIRLNPEHIDAYINLGILLNASRRTEEAAACYCRVITLRPKHRDARKLLVLAHCMLGEVSDAVDVLEAWLEDDPDDPVARHMLAACTGRDVPARASSDFIESTFDSFAVTFESKLERLSYRAPGLVAAMLDEAGVEPSKRLDVLDAGCGTGLCGPLVAPYSRRLVGVDLSTGMLQRAREKNVYDLLLKAELTEYFRANREAFDVIVSADALVYFGDLEPVLVAAAEALRENGLFIFTLERSLRGEAAVGYRLEFHGRYSHSPSYVERLLAASGLQPKIVHAQLRLEAGAPVEGLVIQARKPIGSAAHYFRSTDPASHPAPCGRDTPR